MGSKDGPKGECAMQRVGAKTCCACAALAAMLASPGCALWREREERAASSPEHVALARQLSLDAQTAIDGRDFERARSLLERLASIAPKSAEAQQRLGLVWQLEGKIDQAESSFQHALRLDPEYVGALVGLGEVEAARERWAEALARFEHALEIDPNQSQALFDMGGALERLGRRDDALAAYFRAHALDPSATAISLRIAILQLERREPEQALARLEQLLEQTPDDPEARHQRGRARLALKRTADALADLRFAASKLPQRADVYYHLALALDASRLRADAILAADQAVKLAPGYADARDLSARLRR